MEQLSGRHTAELAYQRKRAHAIPAVGRTPDYTIERYRRHRLWRLFPKEFMFKYLGDVAGKSILDFGCGEGEIAIQLARLGAEVIGVDISPELIAIAKQRAEMDSVSDRVGFIVSDVMETGLPEEMFDVVICYAVLHHVEIHEIVPRLVASLRRGGMAIIVEPVALSRFLQRVHDLIPIAKDTSPGERQLSREDVAFLLGALSNSRATFFHLFGRLVRLFPNRYKIDRGHLFTKTAIVLFLTLDRFLLTLFPFLSRFCGIAVIVGQKPTQG